MKINSCVLLLGLVLLSPQVLAAQKTFDALAQVGVTLSAEHGQAVLAAQGTDLIPVVAEIQSAHLPSIVEVTAAAANAHPENAAAYTLEAIVLAPDQAQAIARAAVAAAPGYYNAIRDAFIQAQAAKSDGAKGVGGAEAGVGASIPSDGAGGGGSEAASKN